ncbi:hypothetical protein RRG08_056442 [Elysia crispata]|uniref:Uncharacterized protein n=1 Tax=Elysia crispata TaxID=231223 RepID=A0AAE1CPT7_9GAST|nr:hypothetical protein RRG08_056442 [Elysia crispata]
MFNETVSHHFSEKFQWCFQLVWGCFYISFERNVRWFHERNPSCHTISSKACVSSSSTCLVVGCPVVEAVLDERDDVELKSGGSSSEVKLAHRGEGEETRKWNVSIARRVCLEDYFGEVFFFKLESQAEQEKCNKVNTRRIRANSIEAENSENRTMYRKYGGMAREIIWSPELFPPLTVWHEHHNGLLNSSHL